MKTQIYCCKVNVSMKKISVFLKINASGFNIENIFFHNSNFWYLFALVGFLYLLFILLEELHHFPVPFPPSRLSQVPFLLGC